MTTTSKKIKLPKKLLEYFQATGAQGGASTSKAKREAAKINGKKGGRPKNKKSRAKTKQ
jgi:hypothetical protein